MQKKPGKRVQVLYFDGCPNHKPTVERVAEVAAGLGLDAVVEELEVKSVDDAERLRFLGSPSVHIDGVDVEPAARESTAYAYACRTYGAGEGIPPRELISSALQDDIGAASIGNGWRGAAAAFPAMGALLLPVGTCPACWPAYAGFLSSLGLGFLLYSEYLLPIAATFLALALGALLYGAPTRRGYGPFLVGLVASGVALVGKFVLNSDPLLYAGLGLLTAAAIWNSWPIEQGDPRTCESYASQETAAQTESAA